MHETYRRFTYLADRFGIILIGVASDIIQELRRFLWFEEQGIHVYDDAIRLAVWSLAYYSGKNSRYYTCFCRAKRDTMLRWMEASRPLSTVLHVAASRWGEKLRKTLAVRKPYRSLEGHLERLRQHLRRLDHHIQNNILPGARRCLAGYAWYAVKYGMSSIKEPYLILYLTEKEEEIRKLLTAMMLTAERFDLFDAFMIVTAEEALQHIAAPPSPYENRYVAEL